MWQPILLRELNELIINQLAECTSITRAQYEANAVSPQKRILSPWGDDGDGFWVVAVFGGSVLWYNDIEGGFNASLYLEEGVIEGYWCNQDTLHQALLGLCHHLPKLGPPGVL